MSGRTITPEFAAEILREKADLISTNAAKFHCTVVNDGRETMIVCYNSADDECTTLYVAKKFYATFSKKGGVK